eukprot:UN00103
MKFPLVYITVNVKYNSKFLPILLYDFLRNYEISNALIIMSFLIFMIRFWYKIAISIILWCFLLGIFLRAVSASRQKFVLKMNPTINNCYALHQKRIKKTLK